MNLTPRLGFIYTCVFLDALGVGLIIPVLPRLIGTLTTNPEAQSLWYGAMMVSYGLMQFFSAPFLGTLSDHIGRRRVLLAGIFGLGLTFAIPALTQSLALILISRILGGMLSANMTVANAYIADITQGLDRASAFGRLGATFGIGFILGPVIGGTLGNINIHLPFWVASGIALLNFFYGLWILPDSTQHRTRQPFSWKKCLPLQAIPSVIHRKDIQALIWTLLFSSFANGILQYTWALYTEYRYAFSPQAIGLSLFGMGVCMVFAQGWLLKKVLLFITPIRLIMIALIIDIISLCGIALMPIGGIACLFLCLYALAGIIVPLINGGISRRTPIIQQGQTLGTISGLTSLCAALAPAVGTPLVTFAQNPNSLLVGAPYWVAAFLTILALLAFIKHAQNEREQALKDQNFDHED